MKLTGLIVLVLLACAEVWAAEVTITGGTAENNTPKPPASSATTGVVTLPGASAPVRPESPPPAPAPAAPPQVARSAPKRAIPADFQHDTASYLGLRMGTWKLADARQLLGDPLHRRTAYSDKNKAAEIFAFADPTGRYRELELGFDPTSGSLQSVFLYPHDLTWQRCVRLWGANVNSAGAGKGRRFYSYLDKNLDVLVDPVGKVISLGLY